MPSDSTLEEDEEFRALLGRRWASRNWPVPGSLRQSSEHLIDRVDEHLSVSAAAMSANGKWVAVGLGNGR